MDLLISTDDAKDERELTPIERDLHDLANLALTMRSDGQVNPLTIVDCSEGVMPSYRIETGERRYWANYINMEFIASYQGDGTVPCIILPPGEASVFRQAKENTSRAGLNAIGMARQVALLILAVHDIHPPLGPVDHDFYRQALELDLRGKPEYTGDILNAIGGITRQRMSQYKLLLSLSDESIELADQHSMDEGKLRHVLKLPVEYQAEALRQIIKHDLDAKQVKRMVEEADEATPTGGTAPDRNVMQFARLIQAKEVPNIEAVAQILLEKDEDVVIVRRRIERLREVLVELERHLEG
jgi:hypothetical protein